MLTVARPFRMALAALVAVSLLSSPALACPFCSAPSLTLSEKMQTSDAVVEIEWQSGVVGNKESAGKTVYRISRIVKSPAGTLAVGKEIELPVYREAKPGTKFLLTGVQGTTIEWDSPMDVSAAAFDYITKAPAPGKKYEERLAYFANFLEHDDELIAGDAYGEFANAPFEEIAKLADQYPREQLLTWILDKKTSATRLGLYGLLIGLSGNGGDAEKLLGKILEPSTEFRLGIEGIMSGYLMLAGEEGLEKLVEAKLKTEGVPFSEVYAVMQTMRFMWTYAPDVIPQETLKSSMRVLLDRSDMADLVISDLARWKDWSVADRVIAMYEDEDFAIPSIKRAIIRYLLTFEASASAAQSGDSVPVAQLENARAALARIAEKDAVLYQQTKRFFRPQ